MNQRSPSSSPPPCARRSAPSLPWSQWSSPP